MTDMYTQPAPEQHDTTAIPRPYPQNAQAPGVGPGHGPGYAPGYGPGYGPGFEAGYPGNPAADAWEAKYLLQRTRTRVAISVAAITSVLALVLGVAAWQFSQANPLLSAASDLASGLGNGELNLDGLLPDGATPDSTTPDSTAPVPPGGSALPDVPISELPLPDSVKAIAATLGITDVGQLLDLAVANGFMTEADADQLRAAIAAGAVAQGLSQAQ